MTQRTSRRSAAHWHRLVILTLLVLAGACSGRDTGARVGMSRQSVLESSTAGLPKRQEVTADEKTDFYDWGWVRYDNQERVVEVYRKPLSDPAVSTAEVLPEGSRLEPIHRIAVAAPTIEIYKTKWFGATARRRRRRLAPQPAQRADDDTPQTAVHLGHRSERCRDGCSDRGGVAAPRTSSEPRSPETR